MPLKPGSPETEGKDGYGGDGDMEAQVRVRGANSNDLPQLARLFDSYRVFYGQASDPTAAERFVCDRLSEGDSHIFVAHPQFSPDRLLGFTQLYPSYSSVLMRRIYILNDLFVEPTTRRAGVGRALIAAVHEFAKEQGAAWVSLETAVTNSAAQRLYESLGYQRDSSFVHYHWQVPAAA